MRFRFRPVVFGRFVPRAAAACLKEQRRHPRRGSPTLLFCAPSRTALPRSTQRRSPTPFVLSLCPCVRQPTTAADRACAHAVPQSARRSASRRTVPCPMGRRRPLSFPEVLFVPAFSSRPSCAVRPLFRPPSAGRISLLHPLVPQTPAFCCVIPCLFQRPAWGCVSPSPCIARTLLPLAIRSPFLYRIPSAAFALPCVAHPFFIAIRCVKSVWPPRPAPLTALLYALRHPFRLPRCLRCLYTPLIRVCLRCAVCSRTFCTPAHTKREGISAFPFPFFISRLIPAPCRPRSAPRR